MFDASIKCMGDEVGIDRGTYAVRGQQPGSRTCFQPVHRGNKAFLPTPDQGHRKAGPFDQEAAVLFLILRYGDDDLVDRRMDKFPNRLLEYRHAAQLHQQLAPEPDTTSGASDDRRHPMRLVHRLHSSIHR